MLPLADVRSAAPARLPVQQSTSQSATAFNDVLFKIAPADVTTPSFPQNSPFTSLTNPLQKILESLWADAITNRDPAKTKQSQIIQATTEAQLWSDEANRLQGLAQQAQAATQAAKTQYGENSPQYLTALANERAVEAAISVANAKAGQAQAQLNVYAADPSYKSAMQAAKGIIDAALRPEGKQWRMPQAQGTLLQAEQLLTQSGLIVQQAIQAEQEYEAAATGFSQLPNNYVPGAQYQPPPPIMTATDYHGPSYETIAAQDRLAYDQRNSLYASGILHLANGNKLIADATVASLQQQLATAAPGTKEYTSIKTALTTAQGEQTTAGTNQQVAQAQYNLAAANVNVSQLELHKGDIQQRALASIYQTNPYWFDKDGFTNLNDDYSGKLQSVKVIVKSDGQLYAEFTYANRKMEIQLTFAPGKEPGNLSAASRKVSSDWASLNSNTRVSTNSCSIYNNVIDQAYHEQVVAQQAVNDLQLKDAQQLITQLTQTYQDAVAKYGGIPLGPYTPGHEPGTPNGPKVPQEVTTAKANLNATQQLYGQLQAKGGWLGFLLTQPLSNFGNQDEQDALRKKFFVSNPGERQREFNQLAHVYGHSIPLSQTAGGQLTAWDTSTKLDNGVGVALNIQPDNQAAAAAGDMNQAWYSGQALDSITQVTDKIRKLAGDNGKVQVMPAFFAMDGGGLTQTALFVVTDGSGNKRIVDSVGRDYSSIDDYQQNNQLPDSGTLYLPNNLDFSTDAKGNASVRELHIDGPSKAWQVADGTVGVVTSVATIMSFTPLAPVAAPIAIAGGTYLGVRAATHLADMAAHGQSWLSKEGMLDLAMVATSALPLAAGSFRLVGLLRSGMSVAPALRTGFGAFYFRNPLAGPFPASYAADAHLLMADGGALFTTAKGLDMASMTIGTPLMVESGYDTAVHWNEMSGFDRFSNALSFASGLYGTGMGARGRMNAPVSGENSGPRLVPMNNNLPFQLQAQPQIQHQQGPVWNKLTVGGGHTFRQPADGEVFLNIDPNAQPDILSDIRQTSLPNASFNSVYFERFPFSPLRETPPLALSETYRILKPGGTLIITTGANGVIGADERTVILQNLKDQGFVNPGVFIFSDDATGGKTWEFRATKPASGTGTTALETQLPIQQQGQAGLGGRRPPTYIQVRDPVTGDVIQATVFRNVQPLLSRVVGADGIVDSSLIVDPTKPLSKQSAKFVLFTNETGTYLLPLIAGGAPRPLERLMQGSKKAGQVVFVRPLTWVGKNVVAPGWRKGAAASGLIPPAAELLLLPSLSKQGVADFGNWNFLGRGPVLTATAVATARGRLNPLTKTGLLLRTAAGSSFLMNAVNNYWKVAEGLSTLPLHPSFVHNVLPIISQGFFAIGQTMLGTRSLVSAQQAARLRPYATMTRVPVTITVETKAGDSWASIAKKSRIPLDQLPVINPGDTLKIYEKTVVRSSDTLQSIATNYGISDPRSITRASGLLPAQITPGRTIVVPHDITVNPDDTVNSLAKQYGDSVSEIRRRNNLGTVTFDQTVNVTLKTRNGKTAQVPKWTVKIPVNAGDRWRWIAFKTGIPLDRLPVISPGDTLKIYKSMVVGPSDTLQSIAADYGISDPRSITRASGLLPSQITPGRTIVVPHDITVSQGDTVNSLARKYKDRPGAIRLRNNLTTVKTSGALNVPLYLWEANTKTSRWLQVAGAYSMSAASGTLFFVDLPKWGLGVRGLGFPIADVAIFLGTGGTATLTALPSKKAGTLAKRFPKTTAVFQSTSAFGLAWKGAFHELAQHDPGNILPPDIQKRDIP